MTDYYLTTVYNVVSYVTQIPVSELRPHSRFSELLHSQEEFYEVYEQCAEALGVPLAPILDTAPVYRQWVSDATLNSWRNLAPL